jgi:predicted enzyme related to lactoylglutathione lyase
VGRCVPTLALLWQLRCPPTIRSSFRWIAIPVCAGWTGEDQGGAVYSSDASAHGPVVYLDTDDIEAATPRIREAGGCGDDSSPIPHIGWFARYTDAEGNDFSLFQSDDPVTT